MSNYYDIMQSFVYYLLTTRSAKEISNSNSEENASELQEHLENMFP